MELAEEELAAEMQVGEGAQKWTDIGGTDSIPNMDISCI